MVPARVLTADRFARPLRDLRVSVTDRCNFRCPYCMPAEVFGEDHAFLPRPELLRYEEIVRIAGVAASLGARKVRITGGEPLMRRDLPVLIEQLARTPGIEDLALTTNGYFLAEQAKALAAAGLRRVTVSLDSIDPETFRRLNGREHGPERVLAGIEAALAAGLTPVKINCVVVRGVNDRNFVDVARYFTDDRITVRFIEFMDVGTMNRWSPEQVVRAEEIRERLDRAFGLEPLEPAYRGEVATRYRRRHGGGEIGIVASVTAPFCRDCTRLRLSSDGKLVTCLFAADGVDIKGPLRAGASDEQLRQIIASVWSARADRYSEERAERLGLSPRKKMEMYRLGG
ncbi:MAG: GTP 3',8-cyclase MoaA [Candidatus Dadabacteria bacterium]|nr:MAG: GTP 3',8-cyclase MoaA [Candidatus Dadabacteria bacterium]